MYSSEPFEPTVSHRVPPVPPPASDSEEWRSDLASRVQNYRARQKNRTAEQQSLGFPPQPANGVPSVPAVGIWERNGVPGAPSVGALGRKPIQSTHDALDTNYYRRLNAHALEEGAQTASAAAAQLSDDRGEEIADPVLENLDADFMERQPTFPTTRALPVDLDLHAPAEGDACLDRYRIHADAACDTASQPAHPPLDEIARWDPAPVDVAPAASAPQVNLLVFPRPLLEPPLWAQPSRDELADPVSRPRILEVPEEIMPAVQGSLFPEIRLDAEEPEPSSRRKPGIEVPLRVAPLSARFKAALTDLAVVASGGGLFAAIASRAMPELDAKPLSILAAAVTLVLWAAYQQMFLLYAGRTVGMRMLGLRLSTFDGRTPQWSERRSRARYLLISCASVALGFLWALVDEDRLCWHDRISLTFPTTN